MVSGQETWCCNFHQLGKGWREVSGAAKLLYALGRVGMTESFPRVISDTLNVVLGLGSAISSLL